MATHQLTLLLSDLTPSYIRDRYLTDMPLQLSDGSPWPDSQIADAIDIAISKFQELTQVMIVSDPIVREQHEFRQRDYAAWVYMNSFSKPIKTFDKFEVKFPTSNEYMEWPIEWVQTNKTSGQIRLVPSGGTIATTLVGRGAQLLPLIQGHYAHLPGLFLISYTPGFEDNKIPKSIIDAICKLAVIQILSVAGDTVYAPGVTSISVSKDGVTQSQGILNNGRLPAVFASRIGFYVTSLYGTQDNRAWNGTAGELGSIRNYYRGLSLQVV